MLRRHRRGLPAVHLTGGGGGVQEYEGRVAAEEQRLATSGEDYTDDDVAMARLDAGLYTLQQARPFARLPPPPPTHSHTSLSERVGCSCDGVPA